MRQIKKKFVAFLMALVMVISFPSVAFAAEETPITTAAELRTAMEGVRAGDVVEFTIAGSFELTGDALVIPELSSVTLKAEDDVTITTSITDVFTVTEGATLTLGENVNIESTTSVLWAQGGTINIDGANITSSLKYALGFAEDGGIINVKSGTVAGTTANKVTLDAQDAGSQINVTGGKVTSEASSAIAVRSGATVTVSEDAYVETTAAAALVAIYADNGGVINVTGGTVKAANEAAVDVNPGGKVSITDGEIVGGEGYSAVTSTNDAEDAVQISGGTFSSEIPDDFLAEDSAVVVPNGDGYTIATAVYNATDLRKAIAAGGTVVVAGDIEITGSLIEVTKDVTIMAEEDVTLSTSVTDLFKSIDGATLTLGEKINIESTTSVLWAQGGTINIDGANITSSLKYALGFAEDGGIINVKSGTVAGTTANKVTLDAQDAGSQINVTGGKVTSEASSAIAVRSGATVTVSEDAYVETTAAAALVAIYADNGGVINVTGGTVKAANEAAVDVNPGGKVSITDGEIVGGEGYSAVTSTNDAEDAVQISGGTFSSDIPEEFIVPGCGDFEVQDGKFQVHKHTVVDVEAVEATCTEPGTTAGTMCLECEEILSGCEEIEATGHTEEKIPAVEATCTEAGATEGIKCLVCDETIKAPVEVAATGHTEGKIPAVEATCTKDGATEGTKCLVCDETIKAQEVIPAAHTLTAVEAKEATVDAEGNKAYYTCECGKWFEDKDAKTEITDKTSVVIPKLEKPEEPTEPEEPVKDVTVSYNTHVQNYGWLESVTNGEASGTEGESKRLEAITIELSGNDDLGISYSTHVQTYGWLDPVADGEASGTEGESKRLEAIKIELTGADKDSYNVWYRVHAQNYGWLGWAKNGQPAGTAGQSKRLEAIEILVLPVGEYPEGQIGYAYIEVGQSADNAEDAGLVNYMTHVQNYGDQSYVYDGSIAGTFGESKRLESISIKLNNELLGVDGGIKYKTHVQNYGWLDFVADGEMSGTEGESKRLEAICIELTGDVAESYDVYYRVHAQTYGWLGWAKNGEEAGTEGLSKRLEAIQIVLVPKGQDAPSVLPGDAGVDAFVR